MVGPGGSTTVLNEVGNGSNREAAWTAFSADISGYGGQTVHLLVEAADAAGGSLVEAGMDDLVIESLGGPNSPPTADDQSLTVDEDGSAAVELTGSDPDGDPLSFSVAAGPGDGSLSGTAPNLTYTPDGDFNGSDSFTFVANDGTSDSAPATVSITVNPVNDAPTTAPVSVSTNEGTAVAVTLQGSDVDGDPLTFTTSNGPSNGTLAGNGPNLTYSPNPGFVGTDSFEYQADDGTVSSSPSTVTITVNSVSSLPFTDNFESGAADWSALFGSGTWATTTAGGSTWFQGSVSNGRASAAQTAGDAGWTDYSFDVDVVTSDVLRRGDGPAILARVVDGNNHYVFRFDNRRWIIERVVGGSSTKLVQSSRTNLGGGTVQLRAEVQGSQLRLYVNGSLLASAVDSTHSAGAVGVGVYGSISRFDNVDVAALP